MAKDAFILTQASSCGERFAQANRTDSTARSKNNAERLEIGRQIPNIAPASAREDFGRGQHSIQRVCERDRKFRGYEVDVQLKPALAVHAVDRQRSAPPV